MVNNTRKRGLFLRDVRLQRETQIIQVATRVLLRKGCLKFRVDDVADACGVAKGTCYQHFGSQADLIAAAVHALDEALAVRLSSPGPRLTEPHQILEWAVLQAVDTQIVAIAHRTEQAEPRAEGLNGKAWPCCLGLLPCPYGGAAQTRNALLRWTTGLRSPAHVRPAMRLAALLALVPTYCLGFDHDGKVPRPRALRSTARHLVKQLFSEKKLHR